MTPQLFGDRIQILQEGLDFGALKNRVIASNIANVETPGYKAFKVIMNEKLGSGASNPHELAKTHPSHLDGSGIKGNGNFTVVKDKSTTMRVDQNNVDLEREMAESSANSIFYAALSQFIARNFAGLKSVISEGKR
jgi:flagellar basal-body rod protein FlgB